LDETTFGAATATIACVSGRGDDELEGGSGNDRLTGGRGRSDRIFYGFTRNALAINLAQGTATGQGMDSLRGVEDVVGSQHDDDLVGNWRSNQLAGFDGDDFLSGRKADDILAGGGGDDTARGGRGTDRCIGVEDAQGCEE
jgi:Ca2+-binding RTX toxin-like protein